MVARFGAGLPGGGVVTVIAPPHALLVSPALDMVEVARTVATPAVETWVGCDGTPDPRCQLYPSGKMTQMLGEEDTRQRLEGAQHLHLDTLVPHPEAARTLHSIHVLLEAVEFNAMVCHVFVCLSTGFEVFYILSSDVYVHVNVPRYKVAKLDGSKS